MRYLGSVPHRGDQEYGRVSVTVEFHVSTQNAPICWQALSLLLV